MLGLLTGMNRGSTPLPSWEWIRRPSADGCYRADYNSDDRTLLIASTRGTAEPLSIPAVVDRNEVDANVRFSPDRRLVAVGEASSVTLWNLELRSAVSELRLPCQALAFSPDGATLAIASRNALDLRAVPTGHPVRRLEQQATVTAVEFDSTGARVAIGCADGCAHVFTTAGEEISRMIHRLGIRRLAFDRTGTRVATAVSGSFDIDDTLRVWDATSGYDVERRPIATGTTCEFSGTRDAAVVAGRGDGARGVASARRTLASFAFAGADGASGSTTGIC